MWRLILLGLISIYDYTCQLYLVQNALSAAWPHVLYSMCCVQKWALHRSSLDKFNLRGQSLLFISREPNLNPALEAVRYTPGHDLNSTVHV